MQPVELETWKPVPGFEGSYEVSDLGRVKSLDRLSLRGHRIKGQILSGKSVAPGGYPAVRLTRDRKSHFKLVHRLVLEAFVGPCPEGMQGCHWDANPKNNRLSNLRWDTPKANAADIRRVGHNRNANKTSCPRGHAYDDENTYFDKKGGRDCRICIKTRNALWQQRNAARYRETHQAWRERRRALGLKVT